MRGAAWRAGWCVALLGPALGCGEDGAAPARPDAAHVVRDSAGVEIVESTRPSWSEEDAWRLSEEPLFRIRGSDGGEENLLLDPVSIDTDSRGRIIIADGNQTGWDAVLVYDSLGRFLFRAGRAGEGPGEFGQLWWASSYRGDSIVGFDMAGDELAVFSPEGRFARMVRTPSLQTPPPARGTVGYTAGMDAAYGDGHFLAYPFGRFDPPEGAGPGWMRHELLRLAPDGESWDSLGTFEIGQQHWNGSRQEQRWFAPFSFKVVGGSELYYGRGDAFQIERYDGEGRLTRIIRKAHDPRPVTEELKEALVEWNLERLRSSPEGGEAMVERVREQMQSAEHAEHLPAFSHAFLDDEGHLWVEHFRWYGVERRPVQEPGRWSVFDTAGVWLGDVETPAGFILREATEDRALGFVVDDLDVREVEAYGLEGRGDGAVRTPTCRILPFLAGLALASGGCVEADVDQGDGLEIRVDTVAGVPVVRSSGTAPVWSLDTLLVLGSIGGGGEPAVDEFGSVPGVTVGPDGLLYVPDQLAHSVKVFRRDGTLARAFGREGQGPGEFVGLYSLAWVGDTLLSLDHGAGRVGLLSPEGDWLGTRPAMGRLSGSPADLRFFPVGPSEVFQMGFEAGDEGLTRTWLRHGRDTVVTARPFVDLPRAEVVECRFAGGFGWFDHRFTPRARQHPAPGGGVWVGDPRSYRIALLDADGDTIRLVDREVEPLPVSAAAWQEVTEEFETWRDAWESAECDARAPAWPESAPFYRTFQVDLEGRLWVERLVDGGHLWEVFDREGRLVGSVPGFDRDAERTAPFLGSSDVAWVSADTTLGVPRVHWATLKRASR